jgi:hypothetical protein
MKSKSLITALLLGTAILLFSVPARADADPSERERALEQRVAELERLVHRLMAEREQTPAPEAIVDRPAREEIDVLRAEVQRLDEQKAAHPAGEGTQFGFSGYIKHDMMYSRYGGGSMPPDNVGRDFYVPATIPVGGETSTTDFDTHIRESRFSFNVLRPDDNLRAYLEFDFSAKNGGDERLVNATSPSVRHAFVSWNDLLAGETWSTFFNVAALPESLDFVGPAEGTIFIRQPQVRYTRGSWQFAVENPETTVTPFGGGGRMVTDTANIPDLVVRYNHRADWGHVTLAVLGRQLGIDKEPGSDRELGVGLSLSGRFDFGVNDLRWMVSGGPGIGRYLGLNTSNGAVLDPIGRLEAIDAYGAFVAYRHWWNDKWRSNLTLSAFRAANDTDLTGLAVTRSAESAHANLIYQANEHLRFGMEYIHARREIESGANGDMNRIQFSTIFGF